MRAILIAATLAVATPASAEPLLWYFRTLAEPEHLRPVVRPIDRAARTLARTTDPSPERAAALRALLIARDAAKRAAVWPLARPTE